MPCGQCLWSHQSTRSRGRNSLEQFVVISIPIWESSFPTMLRLALIPKIGSYGMDTRNSNGDILLDFLSTNGRFASNTVFKHPGRHRPKWTSTIADSKRAIDSKVTKAVFNQIDYVLCQKIATTILKHTRSYWGTDLNSDHKPIIKRLRMNIPHLMHELHTKGI